MKIESIGFNIICCYEEVDRMNNQLNNMLNDFLKNSGAKNEKELNEKLQEFIQKYNAGELEYEETDLDKAYALLEKAQNTTSEKKALKLAKEAYEFCPACFDALLFQVSLEENSLKRDELLAEGLAKEKERLQKEGFFDKDNIGIFYGIFETRPYIRGLYLKTSNLLDDGKYTQGVESCKEILKLNNSDNTGTRYLLMATYALLENEKEALKLYKQYPENNLEMLFPLFALYYKLGNDEKAHQYLDKIFKSNPYFVTFLEDDYEVDLESDEDFVSGYYSVGRFPEVLHYMSNYEFLVLTMNSFEDYILAYYHSITDKNKGRKVSKNKNKKEKVN